MEEAEADNVQLRSIKDQIHDYIPISPLISSIIDTPQFQRLRHVKQLGTSYYVWSGAAHNRFEHCLGVAHLARSMVEHLQREQPKLGITERDVNCVQIAGLCHDLGHGPWSHVWDGMFIPAVAPGKLWKHEDASKMMFRSLLDSNNIPFPEEDVDFILALIDGERDQCSPKEKAFLFDIVANKRNGLDVDKFDYIARDTYMIGEPTKISSARLIQSARVIDNEICFDIKDVNQLFELCHTRFKLHKQVYNHKTAKSIEYMIIDALKLAEPFLKIAEQIDIPRKYLHLTDDIMTRIEASEDPELEESREIFHRIRIRDLYKFVDQRVVEWERRDVFKAHITPERVAQEARRVAEERKVDLDLTQLTPDSVIVDHATMHYVLFEAASKQTTRSALAAQKGDYSIYLAVVQAGYRAVLQSVPDDLLATPPASMRSLDSVGPSTPPREYSKPISRTATPRFTYPERLKRSHSGSQSGSGSLLFGGELEVGRGVMQTDAGTGAEAEAGTERAGQANRTT
ncbi:HD-domain/PDEase-like protein [Mycena amicta]|nr:HD-domain/PDEase-like protein [Mycena amicta]